MRGIAILAIMLHNYCHYVKGIVKENEYQFFDKRIDGLWEALIHPDEFLPMHLLSFFGHYGVPVFLFLSGYGLVRKYENESRGQSHDSGENHATRPVNSFSFLRYHYLKLLRMLIVGFVLFIMVDAVTPGRFPFHWDNVIAQLLMYINVLPEPDKIIWPGIYWFFGLMMQLYIIYRLLLYRRHWGWTVGLMLVCMVVQMVCGPESDELNRLRYNFVGGMLPFGYGLLVARMPMQMPRGYNWLFGLVSLYFIYSLSFSFFWWFFVPLFVCSAGFCLIRVTPRWLLQPLTWMGNVSAALFVVHPAVRKVFYPISRHDGLYTGLLLYVVAAIVLAWVVSMIIKETKKPSQ